MSRQSSWLGDQRDQVSQWRDSQPCYCCPSNYALRLADRLAGAEAGCLQLRFIAQGDAAAFWRLWVAHQKYLYAICLRQMEGFPEDAEDALSRAMLKALDKLPDYAAKIANPKAWLTKLTYNVCLDMHRERKRRPVCVGLIEETIWPDEHPAFSVASPLEEGLFQREKCAYICRAVGTLPLRLREPFVLRFFHELPHQEIARRLTISADNVRKRIQQARALLQDSWQSYLLQRSEKLV